MGRPADCHDRTMPKGQGRSGRVLGMLVAASVLLVVACSDGSSSTLERSRTQPTTTVVEGSTPTTTVGAQTPTTRTKVDELPGLWIATEHNVQDDAGVVVAEAQDDSEVFRSPLDDGAGGVIYLRCTDGSERACAIERVAAGTEDAVVLGSALRLFALGTWNERPVVVTGFVDPARTADFETDRSDLLVGLVDLETGDLAATASWYGWESGPFAIDVEAAMVAVCIGEGETCELGTATDPAQMPLALEGAADGATVTSLALSADATVLTWVESEPMGGTVVAHHRDLLGTATESIELRSSDASSPQEAITDGYWAAVRVDEVVYFTELLGGVGTGSKMVPIDTREVALRAGGGASGAQSKL